MNYLISQSTRKYLDLYVEKKWPVVIVAGPVGIGKSEIARLLVCRLHETEHINKNNPNILIVDPGTKQISIEESRRIKTYLQLKQPGDSSQNPRVILIINSDRMTSEAQNALLKLLEETPSGTLFIMTSDESHGLLKTVISRSQTINVTVPSLLEAQQYFDADARDIEKAYAMSSGRTRYMSELLLGDDSVIEQTFQTVKELLTESSYTRLTRVEELTKHSDLGLLMFAFTRVFRSLLAGSTKQEDIARYRACSKLVNRCSAELKRTTPNSKLMLMNLLVNI